MATTNSSLQKEKILLVKPKSVFKKELSERIAVGQEITKDRIDDDASFITARKEYSEWSDYNSRILKYSFTEPYNEYWRSYDDAGSTVGLMSAVMGGRPQSEQVLNDFIQKVENKIDNLNQLKAKVDSMESTVEEVEIGVELESLKNRPQVFVIYGHDKEAKNKTARFVEKLGFEPVILHYKAGASKTIIEKIEAHPNVGFGIVLYTPCDIGGKKSDDLDLKSRARQNVIFEHGFLIGKIKGSHVCALVKGDIELPDEIYGVSNVQMDSSDSWMFSIAKEMKAVGYEIDMNKI